MSHLILPSVALAGGYIALIARITRATMLEILNQDYIRTARAKGAGQWTILFLHALKNAAVPIVTVVGIGVALLIGGAVITESVFAIPGVGRLTIDAILRRDYPVIQGVVLMFSFVYVLVNLLIDLSYTLFDPRIRYIEYIVTSSREFAAAETLPDIMQPRFPRKGLVGYVLRNPTIAIGSVLLLLMIAIAIFAPYLWTKDPTALAPAMRTRSPSAAAWVGYRHVWDATSIRVSSTAHAVSLTVGFGVAIAASIIGLAIGLISGFVRRFDNVIMRMMDGLMSIPSILLAIALMALTRGSVGNVILAITIVEIPRVSRLVRGVVLSLREQPYVEAAHRLRHKHATHHCGAIFCPTL